MEKEQATTKKISLLAILAPSLCLLPLNTASISMRSSSFVKSTFPFDEKNFIFFGIIAEILIILISCKYFHLYKKISFKYTILWEILLTFVLCVTEVVTESERVFLKNQYDRSWLRLNLYPTCLLIYSLVWPLIKLRHQLYLHRCSEKSNRKMIYTMAICIQSLPNILGQIIIRFCLNGRALWYNWPYFWFPMVLIASFVLYIWCTMMNCFAKETEPSSSEEEKKTLKDVLSNREFLSLFVICTFCGMNENKSQTFVNLEDYPGRRGSVYLSIFLFCFGKQGSFLIFSVAKVGVIAYFGSLFGIFSKRKILHILMTALFGFAVWYYDLLITNDRESLLFAIFGKQGISELIHLAVQLMISERFNGSPEVFFISNAFFSFGDLLKRIVDPMVLGWISGKPSFLQLTLIQAIFLVGYFLSAPSNDSKKKIKL